MIDEAGDGAALLAGVVAVNVAVLRLNLQFDQVGRERSELRADISRLRSELSSASATWFSVYAVTGWRLFF